jgi:hypothetical protein
MLSYSSTIQTDLKVYNSAFITDHPLYASVIVIGDANVIPVAYPDAYNVDQNGVLTVTVEDGVLSNDVDTDNLLTVELVSDVSNGTLVLNADGSFTYTPNDLYFGQDSFSYKVFDRKAYSNIETVIITVNQVFTWNELIADAHEDRVVADGGTVLDKPQLNIDLDTIGEANFNNLTFLINPNGGSKIGKVHAIKPEDGTSDLTVDRNGEASYVAENGTIQFANANEPRIDWSGGKPALLVEPQRTNLIDYSENFDQWFKVNDPVLTKDSIAPNGLQDAWIYDATNGFIRKSFTAITGEECTISIYAKKVGSSLFRMQINGGTPIVVRFDLENGVVQSISSGVANIKSRNDGWFRCSITFTVTSENLLLFNPNEPDPRYEIYGVQIEQGSKATSYIKTEGSTKTRLKDSITVSPPAGTTQIVETIDGVEQPPITTIPASYEVSEGKINQIKML